MELKFLYQSPVQEFLNFGFDAMLSITQKSICSVWESVFSSLFGYLKNWDRHKDVERLFDSGQNVTKGNEL